MKKILLIILSAYTILGCEKDDICDESTSTTPRLVIEFYNSANPTVLKNVTNLKVIASGSSTTFLNATAVNKIKIPIKITEDSTTFQFIENGSDADLTNDNTDELQFTYTRSDLYVSRACGFKKVFNLTNTNTNLVITDTDNWIDNIQITQPNIVTEDEIHIKIYF